MTGHIRIQLPHDEPDGRKRYSMTDPDTERLHDAMHKCRYGSPSKADLGILTSAVADYIHLTTYELGQEHCVRNLRDIWRARRAR